MTKTREKKILTALLLILAGLLLYRIFSAEAPRTRPLQYARGMQVSAPLRQGISGQGAKQDPISLLLARRIEGYPGVSRDPFRLQGDGAPRKAKTGTPVKAVSAPTPTSAMTPTVVQLTPEEIAAESARADLSSFRLLGYLTDKDSSLFLSKDGELFIAKSGDVLLKSYRIKEAGKDFVVLQDTVTKVEVRVELTGSGENKPAPGGPPALRR